MAEAAGQMHREWNLLSETEFLREKVRSQQKTIVELQGRIAELQATLIIERDQHFQEAHNGKSTRSGHAGRITAD